MRQPFAFGAQPAGSDAFEGWAVKLFASLSRAIPRGPRTQSITASRTLEDGLATEHCLYRCDATTGALTVTLPLSTTSEDTVLTLKKIDASGNAITWLCQGTDTVDGAASGTLAAQWDWIRVHCRASGFDIIGQ